MKKQKKIKYKRINNLKANAHRLDEAGDAGWRLVGMDGKDGIFTLEETPTYEYQAVQFNLRAMRDDTALQEMLDGMEADGWRLVSMLQARALTAAMVFEREV
jgi:hypothetical protein